MKDQPELVGISLCERLLQDVMRNDAVTLVNIHNVISAQVYPTLVPIIYAFAQVKGMNRSFSYQFKMLTPDGQVVAASPLTQVEGLANEAILHKIISAFPGLLLPSPGVYQASLEIDGKIMGSIPLSAELIPAMQTANIG
jgi:hypothetical protein